MGVLHMEVMLEHETSSLSIWELGVRLIFNGFLIPKIMNYAYQILKLGHGMATFFYVESDLMYSHSLEMLVLHSITVAG